MSDDFNFLKTDEKEKKGGSLLITLIKLLAFVITIAVIGFMAYDGFLIFTYKSQIKADTEYLESSDTIGSLKQYEGQLNAQAELINQEKDYTLLNTFVDFSNSGNKELFDIISELFTEGIQVYGINIVGNKVTMSGNAFDLELVANYELVLRSSELVEDLYVSNIINAEEVPINDQMSMNSILKGHLFSISFDFNNDIIYKTTEKD